MNAPVICHYCDQPAELVTGDVLYAGRGAGRNLDLAGRYFWRCVPCKAWVGCHQAGKGQGNGTKPMGILANAELRHWKHLAHNAFDPLWKGGFMPRSDAYAFLAQRLGITVEQCHIGMFLPHHCQAVVGVMREFGMLTPAQRQQVKADVRRQRIAATVAQARGEATC